MANQLDQEDLMDSRSEEECTDIRNTVGEATINKINGNRVAPWFRTKALG